MDEEKNFCKLGLTREEKSVIGIITHLRVVLLRQNENVASRHNYEWYCLCSLIGLCCCVLIIGVMYILGTSLVCEVPFCSGA